MYGWDNRMKARKYQCQRISLCEIPEGLITVARLYYMIQICFHDDRVNISSFIVLASKLFFQIHIRKDIIIEKIRMVHAL